MQKEFLHLAYLLTKYECVTLPGFGAFVVQPVSHSETKVSGMFPALAYSLSFNSGLSHNDGLLVSSICKEQQIPYNEANLRVGRFVDELFRILQLQKEVFVPGVGSLQMIEGRISFSPAEFLTCNAINYGLSDFHMPLLSELMRASERVGDGSVVVRDVVWVPLNRRIFKTVTTVAATALLLLAFSTPLRNYQPEVQNAAVVSLRNAINKNSGLSGDEVSQSVPGGAELGVQDATSEVPVLEVIRSESESKILQPARAYFIIVGSLPGLQSAQSQLKLVRNDFSRADIIGNGERYRIYIEKFSDKEEAEIYLGNFRDTHPNYKNAWLLSQKN
ncbi:cell division protein [Bacteroidia bacterium]|nr:cell division protein [Bacteroidia bacterium]